MRYDNPALRLHLATAYALGSLTRRVQVRFERLMLHDADLRELVEEQALRYAPLALALPAEAPSPALWTRIENRLGFVDARPSAATGWRQVFNRAALGWVFTGLAAGLVTGFLIAPERSLTALPSPAAQNQSQLPPSYVGVLADDAGRAGMLVSSLRHARVADVKFLQPPEVPAGNSLYLWGLPADGSAPIALGPLPPGQNVSMTLADTAEKLLSHVSRLAVTLEATASSPPTPTMPYRYLGFCGKFWR